MKSITGKLLSVMLVLTLISCSGPQKRDPLSLYKELDKNLKPNTISENEIQKGWVLLFDGKSTAGWRGFNMDEFADCWTIEDGALTMTTEGGEESQDIITEKKYKNFAFSVEFKLTPQANSGVLYQVSEGSKYQFPYETGPEIQIIDHEGWPTPLEEWQICGANYAMYTPMARPFKPVGEWNHILLVVDGNNVSHLLNGELTVEYEKYSDEWNKLRHSGKWNDFPDYGKYDEGHISLQNHGSKVWFRNIKIKEF